MTHVRWTFDWTFEGREGRVVLGNRVIDLFLNYQALSRLVCEAVFLTSHNERSDHSLVEGSRILEPTVVSIVKVRLTGRMVDTRKVSRTW